MSEYVELCNHMVRRHGVESPANWAAKRAPEERLPAVLQAHEREHAEYRTWAHPMAHDEADRTA